MYYNSLIYITIIKEVIFYMLTKSDFIYFSEGGDNLFFIIIFDLSKNITLLFDKSVVQKLSETINF